MTTKMSPSEVMAKTMYEIAIPSDPWEQFKRRQPDLADVYINRIRAALRALAEMEPAEEIRSHIHDVWAKAYMGDSTSEEACMLGCKTYILAAAKEGEPQI